MRVVLEAQHACRPEPRGISYYTIQLIRHLLKRKKNEYELTFFDGNRERDNWKMIDKYFGEYSIPTHECNVIDYRVMQSSDDVFTKNNYNKYFDVYGDIFHFFHLVSIPSNIIGTMIVTIHDMLPVIFPEFFHETTVREFRLGIQRLNCFQPFVITDSKATRDDVLRLTKVSQDRVFVATLAFDADSCYPQISPTILDELSIGSPFFLYLGGVDQRKNIVRIIEAFECVAEKNGEIILVIAGANDDNSAPIMSKINKCKYRNRIVLTGYVSEEQKRVLMSSAIAFLFPSLYEGFGLPILEAMACGCPVITSNVSSMPEVAGEAAILVNPHSTEQLAYEMERILRSEDHREKLRDKGLIWCKQFTWEKTAITTENVYEISVGKR